MKIAEVSGRFDDMSSFIKNLRDFGFKCLDQKEVNNMFVILDFKKTPKVRKDLPTLQLGPCVYKKR